MAAELKAALGPAGMSETFTSCKLQLASVKTFLLGHTNPVQDVLDYLKTHQEPNEQVMTLMKRLSVEGTNCKFKIHKLTSLSRKENQTGITSTTI